MQLSRRTFLGAAAAAPFLPSLAKAEDKKRKLLIIAGTPSHPPGMHEFNAGSTLLHQCLKDVKGLETTLQLNGYPKDESLVTSADAVMIYCDGGKGHPFVQGDRLRVLSDLASRGVGIMCCHFGVEVVPEKGGKEFKELIGGHYEHEYSCNPLWNAEFKEMPKHPIANGVKPFAAKDEWYFNIRFRDGMKGVTPILTAKPSDATRDGPYVYPKGPYKHIQEAKGRAEHMMWAVERADGGRGVGFTGGHYHDNWANDDFRKVVLNALLWISKVDVPANGVESSVSKEDMAKNLDPKNVKKK